MISSFSQMFSFTLFKVLKDPLSQYTIRFMAIYIPHRCPNCFESVTLIQPQVWKSEFDLPITPESVNCFSRRLEYLIFSKILFIRFFPLQIRIFFPVHHKFYQCIALHGFQCPLNFISIQNVL